MRHYVILASFLILGAGCGDAGAPFYDVGGVGGIGGVGGGSDATGGAGGTQPPVEGTFEVKWGPITVAPGTEATRCVVKRVGNDGPAFVNEIHNELGATSHHFIVYEVDDTVERPDPYECFPFSGSGGSSKLLMITQKADDVLRLPEGVAYEFEAGQMVRLELHFINVSAAPQISEVTTTFRAVAENGINFRADVAFLGPVGFPTIPANGDATYGPEFVSLPRGLENANFFAITGHQHRLGTNVFVEMVDSNRNPIQAIYDVANFTWDEPETVTYDTAFRVPTGGGFNLTCNWTNTTNDPVSFGLSANDEMCFFWAYHYQ